MVKLILENKEWLFSGIGVTVLMGVFFFIRHRLYRNKKEAQKVEIHLHPSNETSKVDDHSPIPIQRISPLSFSAIRESIEKSLPLQRDEVKKIFIGIKVMWDGYLKSASKEANDIVDLRLAPGSKLIDSLSTIICRVSLKDYRELGILPEGAKIRIQGEIAKADSYDVELINTQLFFLGK